MSKWTPEQRQAIDSRGQNLLLSAAAGSGKTAVLVQRVIDLIIKDRIDIDRLLIVTFTQAAAAEMRERINKAIFEELQKAPVEIQKDLRRQLTLLSRASISTIHSFCREVLKKYFFLIDIDPNFRAIKIILGIHSPDKMSFGKQANHYLPIYYWGTINFILQEDTRRFIKSSV